MGIASLVLGIVAIVLCLIPFGTGWVGLVCGIVGIILGSIEAQKNPSDGNAKAGLICSIIGVAIFLLGLLACTACLVAGSGAAASLR